MNKVVILLNLLIGFGSLAQESIPEELQANFLKPIYSVKEKNVSKIVVSYNIFNSEIRHIFEFINGNHFFRRKFDDQKLVSKGYVYLDDHDRIVTVDNEKVINLSARKFSVEPLPNEDRKYIYTDSTKTILFSDKGIVNSKTITWYNKKEMPTKLVYYKPLDTEATVSTADYDYNQNTYDYEVRTEAGMIIGETKPILREMKRDDQGNVTKFGAISKRKDLPKVINTVKYKYDKYGNWTKRIITTTNNSKLIRRIEQKRKIVYKDS